jgi:micrococcal nuclease
MSVHFAYGNELNKSVLNLIDIGTGYNNSKRESPYYISKIINQTKTEGVELVGNVTHVVDGDTLDINGIRIRLSLVDTPERGQPGFKEAKNFVTSLCLGKKGELDVDNGQRRGDRFGREIGVVYCDGINVNEKVMNNHLATILTEYCDISEFSSKNWAKPYC